MYAELYLTSLISNRARATADTPTVTAIATVTVMATVTDISKATSTVRATSMTIRTVITVVKTKRIRYEKKR